MSIEAADRFLTKASQDPQLQAEVDRALETENVYQAVTELGIKHGYEFTSEELKFLKYQSQLQTQSVSDVLSEEELEAMAGGNLPIIAAKGW